MSDDTRKLAWPLRACSPSPAQGQAEATNRHSGT
jgi:hypothetical protein